jgi:hypothetical protein
MYDPNALLAQIDDNKWPILIICAFAMLANYVLFIESFRQSRAQKLVTMPVFCTVFWLSHDLSYVLRFDTWFNGYDHWYTKLFWLALCLTVAWELVFVRQIIRYGREEFAPFLSQRQFVLAIVGLELVGFATWVIVKAALDDPLYVWTFGLALIAYPIFGLATMFRRRSTRGFTPLQPAALTVMCATWFIATIGWFGDDFRSFEWILLAVVSTGLTAVMTLVAVREGSLTRRRAVAV